MSRVVKDEPTRRRGVRGGAEEDQGDAVKAGWKKKALGQMCQLISGRHVDAKDYNTNSRGVAYLTGPSDFGPVNPIISKWTEHPIAKARKGDILITVKGSGVGKINLLDLDEVAISRQLMAVRVTGADPKYVLSYLSSTFDHFQSVSTGAAIPGISREQVLGLEIAMPPLPEQQRIVGILDEAFESIATAKANAEKNLQNARALFENHLQSVFSQRGKGWVEKPLGSLASFRNGINYTKDSKGERVKIVGVRNFQKHFSAPLDDLDTVTIDGQLSEFDSLRQDDILTVRSNGNIELIGRCILVGEVTERLSHSGFTIRIRLSNGEALPRYVCHFMKSASSRKLLTEGGTGTNIKSLNQGMLSALTIPFPPISAQKVLVEKLESLSEETQCLESIYQRKLAAMDELKKSLLHQVFTGEL